MDEIADLKAAIDVLIARSMAQEAMLRFITQSAQLKQPWLPEMDADRAAAEIRDRLRHSSLTDAQIALYEREIQRLLQSLFGPPDQDPNNLPV